MSNEDWVTGKINLVVAGKPLELTMTVPSKPVKPHRMLPIFHQMTNVFVEMSVRNAEKGGAEISCRAGCGACCRQPVPVAETEIYQIAELVAAMDEPRRTTIRQKFAAAVERFEKLNWFEEMRECVELARTETPETVMENVQRAAMRYFNENVACPFLENESCSIHEARPLSCREYLVTSPAANCSAPTAATIDKLPLVVKPSETVRMVGRTQKFTKLGFLPLVRALELAESAPESFLEKSGERWMADFFQNLTRREIPKKGIKQKTRPDVNKKRKKRRA